MEGTIGTMGGRNVTEWNGSYFSLYPLLLFLGSILSLILGFHFIGGVYAIRNLHPKLIGLIGMTSKIFCFFSNFRDGAGTEHAAFTITNLTIHNPHPTGN
jgi:hypothetical protein